MGDEDFDKSLIAAAFALAAERGWHRLSIAEAARRAGLPLDTARRRFPGRAVLLLRFGRLADQQALAGVAAEGPVRDRLFDLLMRRIDALQAHRGGVLALMRALPCEPPMALLLTAASLRSMGWMLEAAGVSATGPFGRLRNRGLLGVWLWALRAWQRDHSEDLSATMAALDQALARADALEARLHPRRTPPPPPAESPPPQPPPPGSAPGPKPEDTSPGGEHG